MNIIYWWSVEAEFRSLTGCGMKLLCSLEVRKWMLLYHLSDGSRVNRPRLGWVLALCRHLNLRNMPVGEFLLLTRTRTRDIFFYINAGS